MPDETMITDDGLTDDAFDLAFEAAALDPKGSVEIEDTSETDTEVADDTVDAPVAEGDEEVADPPEKEESPEVKPEPKPDKEVPPPTPAPAKPDPDAEAAALQAKKDAEDAAAKAAEEAATRETPTEEEQEFLKQAAEDFPEVMKALEVIQRTTIAKIENMLGVKLSEISGQFDQRIAPAEAVASKVAQNELVAAVQKRHADALKLLPKVDEWIASQPQFLQDSYNRVLDGADAEAISTLYDIFKKDTGSAQPPAPSPTAEQLAEKVEKEKRLKAQEGVRSRHTSERAAVDPEDFDGAFEKFAATA